MVVIHGRLPRCVTLDAAAGAPGLRNIHQCGAGLGFGRPGCRGGPGLGGPYGGPDLGFSGKGAGLPY